MMKHLAFAVMCGLTLASMVVTGWYGGNPGGGKRITALQFAGTHEQANQILGIWGPRGIEIARTGLRWDYVFILCYEITLGWGAALAHRFFASHAHSLAALGSAAIVA